MRIKVQKRIKDLTEPTMRGRWHINNQLTGLGDLRLRKADSRDECFLQQLFRSCRPHLAQIPMPAALVDALVRQQYDLQRSSYAKQFPGYLDFLILLHQEPIGNLKLHENHEAGRLHLLDISVLPAHRGRGYGGTLLSSLQALAVQKDWVLRLSVDCQNWRAKRWYAALGFRLENTSATHEEMIWTSAVYAG